MELDSLNNENLSRGTYSINRTLLSFLIFTVVFVFFSSGELYKKSSYVQNKYLRTVLMVSLKPIANLSEQLGLSQLFNYSRNSLLEVARLKNEVDWEDTYYNTEERADIISPEYIEKDEDGGKDQNEKEIEKSIENTHENAPISSEIEGMEEELAKEEIGGSLENVLQNEESEEPLFVPSPYIYNEENPFHLLMVGDSQMYGLANGLKKLTSGSESIEITDISIHSSGFIRGDYYNWEKKLENVFREKGSDYYHAVVILLGMNDYQDVYSGNTLLVRESKEWEAHYRDKIVKVINLLLLNTKKVYWLGMPIVRRASYNDDLQYIEKVQGRVASEYNHIGLSRVSLASIAPGDGVPYTETIQQEDGKIIRLMKNDGIHYTIAGGQYIMNGFLQNLYQDWFIKP